MPLLNGSGFGRSVWVRSVFPLAWLLALVVHVLAGTPLTPFHGDESTQIFMSRDYAYLFLQGDLDRVRYSREPVSATEQHLRLLNGTLNKLLIGLAWHSAGFTISDVNDQWDWGADWDYNQQNGHAPSAALLAISRWPSALLLAAGVVLIFVLGDKLGGRPTACLASLYYVLNPALLINGRRAMMEGSLIAFSLLVVLAGIWLLERPTWRRTLLLGLAAGFALASKHSAVFAVGAALAALLLRLVIQSLRAQDDASEVDYLLLPCLIVATLTAGGVFYALNPAWWGDPLARLNLMLALRRDLLDIQVSLFGGYRDFADQLAGLLRQTLFVAPQYYEGPGWAAPLADSIARYEASPWRGLNVGGSGVGAALVCVMITAGVWVVLRDRQISGAVRWPLLLWAAVTAAAVLLLTPLEWQRYYLPLYPIIGLLAALGLTRLIQVVWRRVRRRPHDERLTEA